MFSAALAMMSAIPGAPLAAQETNDPFADRRSAVEENETKQRHRWAADYGQSLVDEMVEAGVDPNDIQTERCRAGRNWAMAKLFREAQRAFDVIDQQKGPFDASTTLSCRVDRAIWQSELGRQAEARNTLIEALNQLDATGDSNARLRLRTLSELARFLRLEGAYDEALALHTRALAMVRAERSRADVTNRYWRYFNRIALVDLALETEDPGTQVPVLDTLLEDAFADFGVNSFWVADILERIGNVDAAQGRLREASIALAIANGIRSPDPVGVTIDEMRTHFIYEVIRHRAKMQRGETLYEFYGVGYGSVSDWYGVRNQLAIDHGERVDMSAREAQARLAFARTGQNPNRWFSSVPHMHNISREALIGLVDRMAAYGVDDALPSRFNPLGSIDASEVVFTHVDALWFDATEREAAYAATIASDEDYVGRPLRQGPVELLPDPDIAINGLITCDAIAQGNLIVRIACEVAQQMDGASGEGMCPFGEGPAIEFMAKDRGTLVAKGACDTLKITAAIASPMPMECRANVLVDYGDGFEVDTYWQWEGTLSSTPREIMALPPGFNPSYVVALRCQE